MLISIMSQCGYKVGFCSASLARDNRDGIKIGSKEIPHAEFADIAKKVLTTATALYKDEPISREEALFTIALIYFSTAECDTVIFERRISDSSLPISEPPLLSVITSIFEDISEASTDELIPRGTKETVTCIQHKQVYESISKTCAEVGCRLSLPLYADLEVKKISLFSTRFIYRSTDYSLNAFSPCQLLNAITVIEAAHALSRLGISISEQAIAAGISNARLPLMCQVLAIEPTMIVATVENERQIETLIASLAQVNELLHNKIDVFVSPDAASLTTELPTRLSSCSIEAGEVKILSESGSHEFAPQINGIISPISSGDNNDYAALFIGNGKYASDLALQIKKVLGCFA